LLAAQVFLPTAHIAADDMVWDFETRAAVEHPLFMAMAQERMSRYGISPPPRITGCGHR
jgi:hypothetical protein